MPVYSLEKILDIRKQLKKEGKKVELELISWADKKYDEIKDFCSNFEVPDRIELDDYLKGYFEQLEEIRKQKKYMPMWLYMQLFTIFDKVNSQGFEAVRLFCKYKGYRNGYFWRVKRDLEAKLNQS